MPGQIEWRWCHKCQGMFFAGNPSQGVCPADGQAHDPSQSGKYEALLGGESAPGGSGTLGAFSAQQGGWRWCHKCQGMFFAENPSKGVCPADGQAHDPSQSGHYAIIFDDGVAPVGQVDWRWCQKCQGFFFSGNPSQGVCPARGAHDASASGKYQMRFEAPSTR